MKPYHFTPQARSDLLEITDYLLDNSSADRAESIVGVIREVIAIISGWRDVQTELARRKNE